VHQPNTDVGDVPLYVRRWGPPAGPPLLFLHALGPASSAAFLGLGVGPLVDAGWSVAAPDLPGYGASPPIEPDSYAVPALAGLVERLADTLGWEQFVLAGHSWGGAIACHVAAARPDRVAALVLVDSGHLDYADVPGADLTSSLADTVAAANANRLRLPDRAAVAALLHTDNDDVLVDAFLEGMETDDGGDFVSRTPGSAAGAARYHLARSRQSETWPAIAGSGIPTLLMLATTPGEARAVNESGAARFLAAVPQADVRWVAGATHSLITDERERFGAVVADWLHSLG
jgi:pimeloyl-ACP methyl ester carboxylesterase